MSKHNLTRT